MRVRLSEDARIFLREEAGYLGRHSATASRRLLDRINDALRNLSRFPLMGHETSIVPGARRFVVGDYVIDYELGEHVVFVTAIRHGRMQPDVPDIDENIDYERKDGN